MNSVDVRSMQTSIEMIQTSLSAIQKFLIIVGSNGNEIDLEKKYPGETAIIKDRIKTLQKAWEQLAKKFSLKTHEILNQNNVRKYWYDLTQFDIWLTKIKIGILSEENPKTLHESDTLLSKQDAVSCEIKKFKNEYNRILTVGERLIAAALIGEDPEYYILKQRMQELQRNWSEIKTICKNRREHLVKNRLNFVSKCVCVQTDPVAPANSSNVLPDIYDTSKGLSRQIEAVKNVISSTSTKLEEVICSMNMNNVQVDASTSQTPISSVERKGIFCGKYSVPGKTRKGSQTSLPSKKPQKSKSLLNEVGASRKRDNSEEKVCKLTYSKNFTLKEKQPSRTEEISKKFDHENNIDKCLNTVENIKKLEESDKDQFLNTENPIKYFENKKHSKLPFQ